MSERGVPEQNGRAILRKHGGKTAEELEEIFHVIEDGDLEAVNKAISDGFDFNNAIYEGQTPLHMAVDWGHKKIVELLLVNGVDVNAKDEFGDTPLDWADGEIADLLRKHGGNTGEELTLMPFLDYGKDQLVIDGKVGLKFEVLYSSDLKEWQVLDTVTIEASPQIYADKTTEEQPIRFYRVKLVE